MFPPFIAGEAAPATGLEGVIVVSPTQPGPTVEGAPSSTPLAGVDFDVRKGSDIVASFKTDELGRFRISLPPGHYVVSMKSGKRRMRNQSSFEVDVIAGHIKHVQWTCDSGLR